MWESWLDLPIWLWHSMHLSTVVLNWVKGLINEKKSMPVDPKRFCPANAVKKRDESWVLVRMSLTESLVNSWANNRKASQGFAWSEVVNRDHRLKCDMYVSCPASQFSTGTLMPQTFRRWMTAKTAALCQQRTVGFLSRTSGKGAIDTSAKKGRY